MNYTLVKMMVEEVVKSQKLIFKFLRDIMTAVSCREEILLAFNDFIDLEYPKLEKALKDSEYE